MGQNMDLLISHHWYNQQFVPKAIRFLGKVFGTYRGVMEVHPASPMIFNIMVNLVVRAVLTVVCGPQEAHHGMGWVVGERNLVFYVDDGKIAVIYQIWVQDDLTVTVSMLRTVGIETSL